MIFNPATTSPTANRIPNPGYISRLSSRHVQTFLAALDLSFAAALKFDARPGLKFLLQKVASLEQPANLYRQAGAAWTIKIVTLLELCLEEISSQPVDVEYVKRAVTSSDEEETDFPGRIRIVKYLKQTRAAFDALCSNYIDVVVDREGKYSKIDTLAERQIFLLVAQPDDFPTISSRESVDERAKNVEIAKQFLRNTSIDSSPIISKRTDQSASADSETNMSFAREERQSNLHELSVEYSTDSGPESESEVDDGSSRPPSRLGFSESKRIVYNSGRTSREDGASTAQSTDYAGPIRTSSDSLDKSNADEIRSYSRETTDGDAEVRQVFSASRRRNKLRRKSENFLLSRRTSLRFIVGKDDTDFDDPEGYKMLRSRSLMDLQRSSDLAIERARDRIGMHFSSCERVSDNFEPLRTTLNLSAASELSSRVGNDFSSCDQLRRDNNSWNCDLSVDNFGSPRTCSKLSVKDSPSARDRTPARSLMNNSSCDRIIESLESSRTTSNLSGTLGSHENRENGRFKGVDSMEDLLKDYERSKMGFRTNPFLHDVGDNDGDDEYGISGQGTDSRRRDGVAKDSEAHRKAWAETLNTALEWALALPVKKIFI